MSSSSYKRAWEAPVATALSIRSTANQMGHGGDTFMRQDNLGRQSVVPTAPMVDVGARPIPARTETAKGSEADQRTWEGPAITTLVI